jgi:hypothetical protein
MAKVFLGAALLGAALSVIPKLWTSLEIYDPWKAAIFTAILVLLFGIGFVIGFFTGRD